MQIFTTQIYSSIPQYTIESYGEVGGGYKKLIIVFIKLIKDKRKANLFDLIIANE